MPDIINSSFDPRLPFPLDVRDQVQNMDALYAIPNTSRWEGMRVYVKGAQNVYILRGGIDNSFWVPFQFNGGGGILPNGIVVYGEAQQSANNILLNDAWVWRINQVDYQSSDDVIAITPAASGNLRVDIIVGNNLGEFVLVVGTEVASPGPAIEPNIPADTVPLLRVDVNDTGITAITEFVLSAFVRYDINDQGLTPTFRQNARTNIQALSRDTNDSRTGSLTQTGATSVIGSFYQEGRPFEVKFINDTASNNGFIVSNNQLTNPGGMFMQERGSVIFRAKGDSLTDYFIARFQGSDALQRVEINNNGIFANQRSFDSTYLIRRDENYLTYPVTISGTGKLNDVALANGVGAIKFSSGVTEVSGIDPSGDTKELLIWSDNPDGITLPAEDVLSIAANRFHREVNIPYQTWVKVVYDGDLARWVNGNTGELQETDARYFEVIDDVLTLKYILPDIAALQAFVRGPAIYAQVTNELRGGIFKYVSEADFSGSADFGVSFPAQDGGYWVRQYSGQRNALWYGVVADGDFTLDTGTDNKDAFNAAFAPGNDLIIPKGKYMTSPGIQVQSFTNLSMFGAEIKIFPQDTVSYQIFNISGANNVNIYDGKIIGDKDTHIGTEGQFGMGISIVNASSYINVYRTNILQCWGDGIYIAGASHHINIVKVDCDDNRRQGMSIVKATDVWVSGKFNNTSGQTPESGIDIEPNNDDIVERIYLNDVEASGNAGCGVWLATPNANNTKTIRDIHINNLTAKDNAISGLQILTDISTRLSITDVYANNIFASGNGGNDVYVRHCKDINLSNVFTNNTEGTESVRLYRTENCTLDGGLVTSATIGVSVGGTLNINTKIRNIPIYATGKCVSEEEVNIKNNFEIYNCDLSSDNENCVQLTNIQDGKITKNRVIKAGKNGFALTSVRTSDITGNNIQEIGLLDDAAYSGIDLLGSPRKNVVTNNTFIQKTVTTNEPYGITLSASSRKNTVSNNGFSELDGVYDFDDRKVRDLSGDNNYILLSDVPSYGANSQIPAGSAVNTGFRFFDKTNDRNNYWNGSSWIKEFSNSLFKNGFYQDVDENVYVATENGLTSSAGGGVMKYPTGGIYKSTSATTTGALRISIPAILKDRFLMIKGTVYNYEENTSFTFQIGFQSYKSASLSRVTARIIGSDTQHKIRLYQGATSDNIYIGETTDVWNLLCMTIDEVQVSHRTFEPAYFVGWTLGVVSTFEGTLTKEVINTFPKSQGDVNPFLKYTQSRNNEVTVTGVTKTTILDLTTGSLTFTPSDMEVNERYEGTIIAKTTWTGANNYSLFLNLGGQEVEIEEVNAGSGTDLQIRVNFQMVFYGGAAATRAFYFTGSLDRVTSSGDYETVPIPDTNLTIDSTSNKTFDILFQGTDASNSITTTDIIIKSLGE